MKVENYIEKYVKTVYDELVHRQFLTPALKYIAEKKRIWVSLSIYDTNIDIYVDVVNYQRPKIIRFEVSSTEYLFKIKKDIEVVELENEVLRRRIMRIVDACISNLKGLPVKLFPQEGGCWFCHNRIEEYESSFFDTEFDTCVHESCLRREIENGNEEAHVMKYLLGK